MDRILPKTSEYCVGLWVVRPFNYRRSSIEHYNSLNAVSTINYDSILTGLRCLYAFKGITSNYGESHEEELLMKLYPGLSEQENRLISMSNGLEKLSD